MKKLLLVFLFLTTVCYSTAQESAPSEDFADDIRTPAADPISEDDVEDDFFGGAGDGASLDDMPAENNFDLEAELESSPSEVLPTNSNDSAADSRKSEIVRQQENSVRLSNDPLPLIKRNKEKVNAPRFRSKKIYIRHPYARKGLTKINKDNVYIYKTPKSKQDRAASFRLGMFELANLQNPNGVTFDTVYQDASSTPILLFDYEWQKWKTGIGKTGIKVGTGVFFTQGSGRFENGTEASEQFTFVVFPANAGLIHRFQFTDGQWFVPYAEAGGDGIFFAERRDDSKNPALGAALGVSWAAHVAGGASINLTSFGWADSTELDSEYGINSMWLTVEFRALIALGSTYDFSSNIINAGILAEF